MQEKFLEQLYQEHNKKRCVPSPDLVCNWIEGILKLLFPELANRQFSSYRDFRQFYDQLHLDLYNILVELGVQTDEMEKSFWDQLPTVKGSLQKDAEAILVGDPAAHSLTEVIRTYPGFFAIAVFRLAHIFYQLNIPLIPRTLTEYAHSKTGIDIHPGARIGDGFCIDHGTGIVIGETSEIGNNVKIYQGVTLGALSVKKELAKTKRHPTIQDNVVIYAGATILGGDTVIGNNAIIGGNVWLTHSVAPFSRIYYEGAQYQKVME
ncbi:MAG: serine acetyltransferase [Lewinellaceae bacterium]|nr:serine acetyltransferase [Lewinella sp.]MCB9277524.1 serine acetyltransferase [Lewinellaceae bacterium]